MMLKIKLILPVLAAITCLTSCKSNDILDRQQFENILFEMHLSDGVVHTLSDKNRINADTVIRYKTIFEKYKCSRNKFEKSMRAYSRKKETMIKIYENIKLRFETARNDIENKNLLDVAKNISDKFRIPLENAFSEMHKYFENIENIDDFAEKLLNFQKDIPESAGQDSVNPVQISEDFGKPI